MNPGIKCCKAAGEEWIDRPTRTTGQLISSLYVQPPGDYCCLPPVSPAWADNFHDCTDQGFYLWCNANTSNLSGQRRIISYHSSHSLFDFDTFMDAICRWHIFGNADTSRTIQQLWGNDWTSICSVRIPVIQCEHTSKWAQVLLNAVGIPSRLVRIITAGQHNTIGDMSHVALEFFWQGIWRLADISFNRYSPFSAGTMFMARPREPWVQVIPASVSYYNPDATQNADILAYQQAFVSGTEDKTTDWTERIFGVVGIEIGTVVYFKTVLSEEIAAYAAYPGKPANWVPVTNLFTWNGICYP